MAGQHSAWMPGGGNSNSSNSLNNLVSDGNAIIPMDYNQKRHLSPPSLQRVHHSSSLSHDDDYLSDTSDISSIGLNGHHGRGGSSSKEKKQPEGVDFELLQGNTVFNANSTNVSCFVSWLGLKEKRGFMNRHTLTMLLCTLSFNFHRYPCVAEIITAPQIQHHL
jgi:hypothetical protein